MGDYTFSVRTALMPLYFKDFHCLAGACQDDCCNNWTIAFQKKDYLKLKRTPMSPELQEQVTEGVSRYRKQTHGDMYAQFKLRPDGQCPFHREDGLCRLQAECGAEVLPRVCQEFPRQMRDTPAGREYALSPACEGLLSLLWNLPQGIDFLEEPLSKQEWATYSTSRPFAAHFSEIRSVCIDVLQERSLRLPQRFLLLGVLLQQLQKLDWETGEGVDTWLAQGEASLHDRELAQELEKLTGNKQMFLTHNHGVATMIMVYNRPQQRKLAYQLCESIKVAVPGKERRTVLDVHRYQELERSLLEKYPELDQYFFENLMVSVAFRMQFPYVGSPEDMWRSYVNLCSLYSLYRFSAVCGSAEEVSRKRLFHVLVNISRTILHNATRQNQMQDELFRNDSTSLAHMAILVNG